MSDVLTDNFGLTKIEPGSTGWAAKMNGNLDKIGKLFVIDNAGNMWFVNNAIYDPDTDTWSQPDTSIASIATKLDTGGNVSMLKCAAGNAAITWINASLSVDEIICNKYGGKFDLITSDEEVFSKTYDTPYVTSVYNSYEYLCKIPVSSKLMSGGAPIKIAIYGTKTAGSCNVTLWSDDLTYYNMEYPEGSPTITTEGAFTAIKTVSLIDALYGFDLKVWSNSGVTVTITGYTIYGELLPYMDYDWEG